MVVVTFCFSAVSTGCTTTMMPVRPSDPVVADGPPLAGLRFDGEDTRIREPGVPVSPSRLWQREVANYTAKSLNRALSTDDTAPAAETTASFDLAEPPPFSFGPSKQMTIALTSTLPDGSVVRSKPVSAELGTLGETMLVAGLGIGGTVLDVASVVAVLFFITSPDVTLTGAVLVGSLALGLGINLAQGVTEELVTRAEEQRWSDLYAAALRAHAVDVRNGIGRGPPPGTAPSLLLAPGTNSRDPSDVLLPPPPLAPAPPTSSSPSSSSSPPPASPSPSSPSPSSPSPSSPSPSSPAAASPTP
jgi:hypothetical protein